MPVVVGLTSITGISTVNSGSDAVYKDYVDNVCNIPSTYGNEEKFLFTNGVSASWQPIGGTTEYTSPGTYTFNIPESAQLLDIELVGGGGGGAAGNSSGSSYVTGSYWTLRTSGVLAGGTILNGASASESSYVISGAGGLIATSTNSLQWTLRTLGTTQDYRDVIFASNFYLAVGTRNVTSPDGITWTLRTLGNGASTVETVNHTGSLFVYGGTTGIIASSTNGIQWTLRTSGTVANINGINFEGGFIFASTALSAASNRRYSTNAIHWVNTSGPHAATGAMEAVKFGNQLYVAVGTGGSVETSTNATVWTLRTSTTTSSIAELTYSNGMFMFVSGTNISISTNGIAWQVRTISSTVSFTSIFNVSNNILTGGFNGLLASSPIIPLGMSGGGGSGGVSSYYTFDRKDFPINSFDVTVGSGGVPGKNDVSNWIIRTTPTNSQGAPTGGTITYGNDLYLRAGIGGIIVSTNLLTWVLRTGVQISGAPFSPTKSTYGTYDYYVIGSGSGSLIASTDTIIWTLRTTGVNFGPGGSGSINGLTYANSQYVIGGASGPFPVVMTSTDTITWILRTSASNTGIRSLEYILPSVIATGIYISGETLGAVSVSTNAIQWSLRTTPITPPYGVLTFSYGNGIYLGAGGGGRLITSTNSVEWTLRTSGFGDVNIESSVYGDGNYVIAGDSGKLYTSTNAIQWSVRTSYIIPRITSLTYYGYFAADSADTLITTQVATDGSKSVISNGNISLDIFESAGGIAGKNVEYPYGGIAKPILVKENNFTIVSAGSTGGQGLIDITYSDANSGQPAFLPNQTSGGGGGAFGSGISSSINGGPSGIISYFGNINNAVSNYPVGGSALSAPGIPYGAGGAGAATSTSLSPAVSAGQGIRGGGGGGGSLTVLAGGVSRSSAGGTGGDGYVRISWS